MARIAIVTAGHLATCPRMLKAADALAGAGHRVRVVSARHTGWAVAADAAVGCARAGSWDWTVVNHERRSAPARYLYTGLRFRSAQALARILGPARCPAPLAALAYSRAHSELARAALAGRADLVYGGTTGALAAVAAAGRAAGLPYALDLEDFHTAEQGDDPAARLAHALAERVEGVVLRGAAFLTAASRPIADAYTGKYGVRALVVHNTFPLPGHCPELAPSPGHGLRLYWFSQTIGPGRGLEDAVRAMGLAGIPGELHLRGRAIADYMKELERLAVDVAPALRIVHHAPAPPDAMVDLCRGLDVGLALEPGFSANNSLALSNKALTYILGGLAMALTDTPGHRPLAADLGRGAILFAPGDVPALAAGLKAWAEDKSLLMRARGLAWRAARERWHWEHPEERSVLLDAVAGTLARQVPA